MTSHDFMVTFGQWTVSVSLSTTENSSPCWGHQAPAKTTCLRLIAGFEQLSGGAISIFGRHASELPPWERDVNTVF
ncbi:putrescine/spermidine ABC transporter ATPase protein [Kluyvera intermedia]|nr:putrescine/spermidine ABC transporter ATPase protein [Kluyvera intermedia]